MSDAEYITGLESLRAAEPGNLLLRTLTDGGATMVNKLLLKKALEKLDTAAIAEDTTPKGSVFGENDDLFDGEIDPTDTTHREMVRQLGQLFAERNRLSDRFKSLKSVADRAANSEDIQQVQRNIERTMLRIRHWKIHNVLPDGDDGKDYLPKDGLELAKRQASLRANISRKKKEVSGLEKSDLSDPRQARKLERALDWLRTLRAQLDEVDAAIKKLKNP